MTDNAATIQSNSPPRKCTCWLDTFVDWTSEKPTPLIFRKWAGISAIASALERRSFIKTNAGYLYPNMFVVLVGPPGTGKDFALNPMEELLMDTKNLNIAPQSMSDKGMLDVFVDPGIKKKMQNPITKSLEDYSPLIVCAPELGVFLKSHDLGILNNLNELFNCRPTFKERIRTTGQTMEIVRPCISVIAGTQPKYIGTIFPEEAYGMGFTSRVIFVYHGDSTKVSLFGAKGASKAYLKPKLLDDLVEISNLSIQFSLTDEAIDAIEEWHMHSSEEDKPTHSKLIHYNTRRIMHLLKLCMVKSTARSSNGIVELEDFEWALDSLREVEQLMPQIFKEISSGGQMDYIEESFNFLMRTWVKTKKPIPEHKLIHFLSQRVPANQIQWIINTMLHSKIIQEIEANPGLNIPAHMKPPGTKLFKPIDLHKIEE